MRKWNARRETSHRTSPRRLRTPHHRDGEQTDGVPKSKVSPSIRSVTLGEVGLQPIAGSTVESTGIPHQKVSRDGDRRDGPRIRDYWSRYTDRRVAYVNRSVCFT